MTFGGGGVGQSVPDPEVEPLVESDVVGGGVLEVGGVGDGEPFSGVPDDEQAASSPMAVSATRIRLQALTCTDSYRSLVAIPGSSSGRL